MPLDVPYWSAIPFVVLLLAIAILPLLAGHWWHRNANKALVALPIGGLVALYMILAHGEEGIAAVQHTLLDEYFAFLTLLWTLFTISGGIVIEGDFHGRPRTNTSLLAIGAALASVIGTTGASMLLIRPFLRMNHGRKRVAHLPVFFIFSVSNFGGLLTPLGDPPLFLGYLKGVPFEWTIINLKLEWLIGNGILLAAFFLWDSLAWRADATLPPADARPFAIRGGFNFFLLAGVTGAVLLKSFIVKHHPDLKPYYIPELVKISLGLASLALTPRALRRANSFAWGPIIEVAVLFAGIFLAMIPAIELLKLHGGEFGITEPWQYFWLTGSLSSFLDNAPTYVTFGTLAAGGSDFSVLTKPENTLILMAISCGAVFMGANTYIGNGPNFMVKAMAEEDGYPMPSFFGYMLYAAVVLGPIYGLLTWLFFMPGAPLAGLP